MKNFKILQLPTDRTWESLSIYFKDIQKLPLLSQQDIEALIPEIQSNNQEAIDKVVKANLRFVISVAKKYQHKGLPLIDLIQEGNMGLIESVRRYDLSKGVKFISYALYWIRQAILKALSDQCRVVRIPMNQITNSTTVYKAIEEFEKEHERLPSNEELEKITNIQDVDYNDAFLLIKSSSLEQPNQNGDCLIDSIKNENSEDTDTLVIKDEVQTEVHKVLNLLPEKESDILKMYFGIGMYSMPYEEIAKYFGVGYERIRQIVQESLEYIRKNYSSQLSELL